MPAPSLTKGPPLKEIVFVDLDNVLEDFASGIDQLTPTERTQYEGRFDEVPGLFSRMSPLEVAGNSSVLARGTPILTGKRCWPICCPIGPAFAYMKKSVVRRGRHSTCKSKSFALCTLYCNDPCLCLPPVSLYATISKGEQVPDG